MGKANAKQAVQRAQELIAQGKFRQASTITSQLASAFPKNHVVLALHASTLNRRGLYAHAISTLTQAKHTLAQDAPQRADLLIAIAHSHTMLGNLDQAIQTLLDALSASQDNPTNNTILAALIDRYIDLEDHDSALKVLAEIGITTTLSNATNPTLACAWARAHTHALPIEDLITQLTPLAQQEHSSPMLTLTLGRLCEQAGQHDQAFGHYKKANTTKPPIYNRAHTQARLDHILKEFSVQSLKILDQPKPDPSAIRPILIVAMPRSGTSLVEQILSAHPSIAPAGESQALPELAHMLNQSTLQPSEFQRIYLEELKAASNAQGHRFVTDKNPMNLFLLAHALAIAPNAIVVRVHRDPRDVCLSCYTSPLARDHTYKFDLSNSAHFASSAHIALNHLKPIVQAAPHALWIDVIYEELAQSPKETITKLLTSIGLEPHPDCFSFHTSSRAVQTISRDQVREPMHTKSVARWQKFAHQPEIKAMIAALEAQGVVN